MPTLQDLLHYRGVEPGDAARLPGNGRRQQERLVAAIPRLLRSGLAGVPSAFPRYVQPPLRTAGRPVSGFLRRAQGERLRSRAARCRSAAGRSGLRRGSSGQGPLGRWRSRSGRLRPRRRARGRVSARVRRGATRPPPFRTQTCFLTTLISPIEAPLFKRSPVSFLRSASSIGGLPWVGQERRGAPADEGEEEVVLSPATRRDPGPSWPPPRRARQVRDGRRR